MNDIRVIMLNRYKEDKYKDGDIVYMRIVVFRKGVFLIYLMSEKDYNRTKLIDQYYIALMDYSSSAILNATNSFSKLYSTVNVNILSSIDIHGFDSILTVYCNVTNSGALEIFSDDENGNRVFWYTTHFDTGTGEVNKKPGSHGGEINTVVDVFNFADR